MNLFVAELQKELESFRNNKQSSFRKKQERKQREFMVKQKRQANARRSEQSPLRNEDFYYTDASKYANKYYGETFRETTRFDNDWN